MDKIKINISIRSWLPYVLTLAIALLAIAVTPSGNKLYAADTPQQQCSASGGTWLEATQGGPTSGPDATQPAHCTCTAGKVLSGSECVSSTDTTQPTDFGRAPVANTGEAKYTCGKGGPPDDPNQNVVHVSFDFGCVGGDPSKYDGAMLNPIVDIAFAIFRFLSAGVGLIVIGSIILAGIQYTASRGEPQATGAAIQRVTNSLIALLIFIFMFAIANFLVPGGMFL